jgi:glutamate transport system substrate-binding protein
MAELAEAGSITIGTKFDQPLFGLVGPDGVPVGFDVEIGKIIAGALGIAPEDIEWVETVSANREPFIENGEVDIVVATYTINDERKQVVDFAGPYFEAGQSILVLESNEDIQSEDDLVGQPVCSVSGSTPAANLRDLGAEVIETDTYSNCLEPLRSGQAVAVSTDNVILAGLVDQNPGEFKVVGEPFTEEPYGIGLMKGDDDFRSFINDVLEESYEDGTYEEAWEATAGTVLEFRDPPAVDRY